MSKRITLATIYGSQVNKLSPKAYRHVLVVENEPLMRDLLARSIESAGFVVTTAANAADAKRAMKSIDPDAMVVDIELGPGPNGFELVESLAPQTPAIGIVFLTNLPDPRFGAKDPKSVKANQAYLRKGAIESGDEVVNALEAVLRDGVTREYRHDLASNRPLAQLSRRQIETLALVSEGKTNSQIAQLRGTTVRAVESMLSRIFEMLGIDQRSTNPRVEAVAKYLGAKAAE
jgi:DNA-binding NarL/FixJ family response regulator